MTRVSSIPSISFNEILAISKLVNEAEITTWEDLPIGCPP